MRIEVLYVPGCPNYQPAVERVEKVLLSESLRADIERVPVNSEAEAKTLRFPGSPTIRVNGTDVEPSETKTPGLACRLYANSSGIPSEAMLLVALSRAKEREGAMRVAERATPVAAVIAALSTLACCLPFGFLGAVGLAGASVRLQAARPWLLVGAFGLLVVGFLQLYRGRNQCRKGSPFSIALFWMAAALVLLIVLVPQVIASLVAGW